ncbi:MAG: DUF2079 domain-containing protein [Candidatus Bathyarchaeia archaeon]
MSDAKISKFTIEDLETWLGTKFRKVDRSSIILSFLVAIYTLIFSSLTIMKHHAFKTYAWDLGIFTQSLWTTLYANKFFYHTCELFINPSGSFFGVHFSPILFFILPFYRIFTIPETLLVLQSFVIALAALPIYKLATDYLQSRLAGLTFALAYLTYPAIQWVNYYDFHVQAFLPLFFTFVIYYAFKKSWGRYFIFLVLSLMCIEHVAFISSFIGLYIAWKFRKSILLNFKQRKILASEVSVPLFTILLSITWYLFTLWQRDTFFPINPATMEEFLGAPNFTILGARSPLEIPLLIILRPLNAIQALLYNGHMKLLFLFLIFSPLAFYSFKDPSALIPTIPWFVFSFMSQTLDHYALGNQYPAFITAFIFIAAIFGVKNAQLKGRISDIKKPLKIIIACTLIIFTIASPLSPLVCTLFPEKAVSLGEREKMLANIISEIPENASILTQDNIFPHLSHRVNAYVIPKRFLSTSIRDLVINFVNQTIDQVDYVLLDIKADSLSYSSVAPLLESKQDFILVFSGDNNTILLYQRRNTS